jgi:hypothetical protein
MPWALGGTTPEFNPFFTELKQPLNVLGLNIPPSVITLSKGLTASISITDSL